LEYEDALLLFRQGSIGRAMSAMSHVIEYDKKNNPRDLWYDLPYLAKMEDALGNTTSSLKWFEGMAHAPPNSSPVLKAF